MRAAFHENGAQRKTFRALRRSGRAARRRASRASRRRFRSSVGPVCQARRLPDLQQTAGGGAGFLGSVAGCFRGDPRALHGCGSAPAVRGCCAGARAKRPEELGALALCFVQVRAPDVRRVGGVEHREVVVGGEVLPSSSLKGGVPERHAPGSCFKWIRVLFRCWVDRKPYDEAKYLEALQKRHSPLLQVAAAGAD